MITALIYIAVLVFNVPPYIKTRNGTVIGYEEYSTGIPIKVRLSTRIPDTSLALKYEMTSTTINIRNGNLFRFVNPIKDSIHYSDTITLGFERYRLDGPTSGFPKINGVRLDDATIYVKPETLGQKILFSLPNILPLLVIFWTCWQLSLILQSIYRGESFVFSNYKRFLKIGYAIVVLQGIYIAMSIWLYDLKEMQMKFTSNIPNYRQPFDATIYPIPLYSLPWLAVGCLIIILSYAFRKGSYIQEDHDLTI
jgi:hypothetical protein